MTTPLEPRITKSTAVPAIRARFKSDGDLLKRYEISKAQANLWDGERDGLREVVKLMPDGQYDNVILSTSESAPVLYPNADGKYQLESCLQTSIPLCNPFIGDKVITFRINGSGDPIEFLNTILHALQKGKAEVEDLLCSTFVGAGEVIDNAALYEKKGASKAKITILPE